MRLAEISRLPLSLLDLVVIRKSYTRNRARGRGAPARARNLKREFTSPGRASTRARGSRVAETMRDLFVLAEDEAADPLEGDRDVERCEREWRFPALERRAVVVDGISFSTRRRAQTIDSGAENDLGA